MKPAALIALVVLLWAIGLEEAVLGPEAPSAATAAPVGARARRRPLPPLPRDGLRQLNRDAFLASFERQARQALLPCLKDAIAGKGQALLMARVHKSGRLTAARVVAPELRGSPCAGAAIAEMRFDPADLDLKQDSLEIEWRYDW
jgi:hypothetical protein